MYQTRGDIYRASKFLLWSTFRFIFICPAKRSVGSDSSSTRSDSRDTQTDWLRAMRPETSMRWLCHRPTSQWRARVCPVYGISEDGNKKTVNPWEWRLFGRGGLSRVKESILSSTRSQFARLFLVTMLCHPTLQWRGRVCPIYGIWGDGTRTFQFSNIMRVETLLVNGHCFKRESILSSTAIYYHVDSVLVTMERSGLSCLWNFWEMG